MASVVDHYDPKSQFDEIHPRDKKGAAHRFFLEAASLVYGETNMPTYPKVVAIETVPEQREIIIELSHPRSCFAASICTTEAVGELTTCEFEVGTGGIVPSYLTLTGYDDFHTWTKVAGTFSSRERLRNGVRYSTITLHLPQNFNIEETPFGLRYGWGNVPRLSLISNEGLPLRPFWKRLAAISKFDSEEVQPELLQSYVALPRISANSGSSASRMTMLFVVILIAGVVFSQLCKQNDCARKQMPLKSKHVHSNA